MTVPSVYVRGSKPQIDLTFTDTNGETFEPVESRLTITEPDGSSVTVSGVTTYLFEPQIPGWYEYYGWGIDVDGREISALNGFYLVEPI